MPIKIYSEIGQLKKVLLHRPHKEILNLIPEVLEELLFEDIPSFYKIKEEHDAYANLFRENGVEVVYLNDLMTETLNQNLKIRNEFIEQYLLESKVSKKDYEILKLYLNDFDNHELVLKTMSGIPTKELLDKNINIENKENIYTIYPMPNLYFTRDSFATVGKNVSINHMLTETRNRETIYGQYIFSYHEDYKNVKDIYGRNQEYSIEGGDIIVLSNEVLLVGYSLRTSQEAIKKFAQNILIENKDSFKYIIQISIDQKRAFMHLDTVFTQLDENSFLVHPEILDNPSIYIYKTKDNKLIKEESKEIFENVLKNYLKLDEIKFYYCGGNDLIASKREQWSDGANVVCISPGKFIVYKRNFVTNNILKEAGFEVLEFEASNLSMGRGGPRCMSMPLVRE